MHLGLHGLFKQPMSHSPVFVQHQPLAADESIYFRLCHQAVQPLRRGLGRFFSTLLSRYSLKSDMNILIARKLPRTECEQNKPASLYLLPDELQRGEAVIEPILALLIGTLIILAIIAANGYFVAQEFAYMAVDRTRLAARAAEGDAAAKRALKVTKRTSFMLSGAQLGITITGLLVGFVAEPLIGRSLGVLLGGAGIPAEVGVTVGTVLALVVATLVQMIFGELYPKNLAIANAEPLARGLARSTLVYLTVFGWLIGFFDRAANLFLRLLRIEPVHDLDVSVSADDLPRIISDSRDSGDLPLELSLMMDRILDFPQRDVEHAMIPRSQVDWLGPELTLGKLR